ncbi:MAG: efflux RND transporter permease subunit [Bacteroidales bacterium]|nr:efflux RND transporter permease subunit [Bacteroidales bacterium]
MNHLKISYFKIFIIFGILSLIGLSVIPFLNIKLNPQKAFSYLYIHFNYPQANPESIENNITSRLEGIAASIKGIEEIDSESAAGAGIITLKITKGYDLTRLKLKLNSAIRNSWKYFPEGMQYPIINTRNPQKEELTLMSYQLTSSANMIYIKTWIENQLSPQLLKVKGSQKVIFDGIYNYEIHLNINTNKTRILNISFDEIQKSILDNISITDINNFPLWENNTQHNLIFRVYTDYSDINKLLKIPIKQKNNHIIHLSDIAKIDIRKTENNSHYRVNTKKCVFIRIIANKDINNLKLARRFKRFFKSFESQIPQNINISIATDNTQFIKDELLRIAFRTILTLFLLLTTIWITYKDKKYISYIIITFIINISIACTLYYFLNIEIHFFAMAGITLSFGMMIDNSIIVIDYIKSKNNIRIILPLFAATLTTIGALYIVNIVPIHKEDFWFDFTMVIIINLTISFFSSLILIPALIKRYGLNLKSKQLIVSKRKVIYFNQLYAKYIHWAIRHKFIIFLFFILLFGIPFFAIPEKINPNIIGSKHYNKLFNNPTFSQNIRPWIDKILGGTLKPFLDQTLHNYKNNLPSEETILISAQAQPEYKLFYLDSLFYKLELNLKKIDNIKQFELNLSPNKTGRLNIRFKNKIPYNDPYLIYDNIIDFLQKYGGGIDWHISYKELSTSLTHEIKHNKPWGFYLYGYNYKELLKIAQRIKQNMYKDPRVKHISIVPENNIWNRKINTNTVFVFNKHATVDKSKILNNISDPKKQIKLKQVKYKDQYTTLYLRSNSPNSFFDFFNQALSEGAQKLTNLGKLTEIDNPQKIIRHNQQYQVFLEYNYLSSAKLAYEYQKRHVNKLNQILPPGFSAESYYSRDKQKTQWLLPIALIIVCIFFISSILFESLSQAFYIIFIIPFSYIGVFITFLIFDIDFDQGGYASFLILGGTVVNASIYILNTTNNYFKQSIRNYIKACNTMFVPILLTIVSTILGFIPFIVGQSNEVFWKAFASGTIGGLVFSIPLVLLLLPLSISKNHK